MALFLPLVLNFASAISWIMLVQYVDTVVQKTVDPSRYKRMKLIYRIACAAFITAVNYGMYFVATSTIKKPVGLAKFYELAPSTLVKAIKVLVVNTILFSGNWLCQMSQNFEPMISKLENRDLEFYKTILIAPWLEEMLFTVLGYWSFVTFNHNSTKKSSTSAYVIFNGLIFALAHLHMKWEQISLIWSEKKPESSRKSFNTKIRNTA